MPSEVANLEKPDFAFIPKGNHEYVQRGYYLVCNSCEIQHAIWVGADKILTGFDEEHRPILKTRKELGLS